MKGMKNMTQINTGNSMAFGCGACAAMKKICLNRYGEKKADIYYKDFQNFVKSSKQDENLTHGQAASKMFKTILKVLGL